MKCEYIFTKMSGILSKKVRNMSKAHAIHNGGFGGSLEKLNMAGITGKLKSLIEYIQIKRLEQTLMTEPPEIQSQLTPYIQQYLRNMQYRQTMK